MATLEIPGRQIDYHMPRLGTAVPLLKCGDRNVTKSVRTALRKILPASNISVTCAAKLINQRWEGKCKIDNKDYNFFVF